MFQWSIGPLVHWYIGPLVHWSIGLWVHWSIGPLVHWSIGPLVHWSISWMSIVVCQMSTDKCQSGYTFVGAYLWSSSSHGFLIISKTIDFKIKSPIFWSSYFINYLSSVNWVVIHKVASHFSTPSNKLTTSHSGTDICSTSDNGHQLGKFIKQVTFCKPLKYTARKFITFFSCPVKNSRGDLVTHLLKTFD